MTITIAEILAMCDPAAQIEVGQQLTQNFVFRATVTVGLERVPALEDEASRTYLNGDGAPVIEPIA